MPKSYVEFKADRIIITQDADGKTVADDVLYKTIKSVNMFGQTAFYFKGTRKIYFLHFKNYTPENAIIWFKVLIMYKDRMGDAKNDIKKVDIGENFGAYVWEFNDVQYNFSYKNEAREKVDVRTGFNPDILEIWISDG